VSTSFLPFSFSVSFTFGPGVPLSFEHHHQQRVQSNVHEETETYIPQTLVVGAFFAVFLARVVGNLFREMQERRRRLEPRRRQAALAAEEPNGPGIVTEVNDEDGEEGRPAERPPDAR